MTCDMGLGQRGMAMTLIKRLMAQWARGEAVARRRDIILMRLS